MSENQWQDFFNAHASVYMENCFTRNTVAEVDFLLDEFRLPPGSRILEIGCGTGRHSIELAKRGYQVTGIDLSHGMLAEASKAANAAGVVVEFIQADAIRFTPKREAFDAAICLCEGAFCLLGQGDDPIERDLAILRNITAGLKPGAPFMLTVLNACRIIRAANGTGEHWTFADSSETFDPLQMTVTGDMEIETSEGSRRFPTRERVYLPTELTFMCRLAGLSVDYIWGGTAGNWGRRPLDADEIEFMVVGHR